MLSIELEFVEGEENAQLLKVKLMVNPLDMVLTNLKTLAIIELLLKPVLEEFVETFVF